MLKDTSDKICDYIYDHSKPCYVELGKKSGNFTPAFSMCILPAEKSGHMKIEVDIEIADNDMRNVINCVYDTLSKNRWTISRQNVSPYRLPECISGRYNSPPAEWVEFLNSISVCVNPDEIAWFLCTNDFNEQGDDAFRWNEFELMSLQAAIDDSDEEWQSAIVKFWDNHLPIYLSVAGGYEYYAIRMSDGVIVHGAEPEFEETTDAAPSFAKFMEMICAGDIL